jgi:hypothetical protein
MVQLYKMQQELTTSVQWYWNCGTQTSSRPLRLNITHDCDTIRVIDLQPLQINPVTVLAFAHPAPHTYIHTYMHTYIHA